MDLKPTIHAIFTAPAAGVPMASIRSAKLIQSGIEGDRYAKGNGAYSKSAPQKIRHISLISEDAIHAANQWLSANNKPTFAAEQTRRNIVISNISAETLNQLLGKLFYLGDVLLKGVELCTPCQRPAKLLNKSNFLEAFEAKGGLRAQVITIGTINVGDAMNIDYKEQHDSLSK